MKLTKLIDTKLHQSNSNLDVRTNVSQNKKIKESSDDLESKAQLLKHAIGIGKITGTRPDAIRSFVINNSLNISKLHDMLKRGSLSDRMKFGMALSGTPGNLHQKAIINLFKEEINEDYSDTYFHSFTDAVEYARRTTEKRGFEIDEDDWQTQIALGGRYTRARPSIGKTHSFSVGVLRNGKPQKKSLNISIYGLESGKYELTHYIN